MNSEKIRISNKRGYDCIYNKNDGVYDISVDRYPKNRIEGIIYLIQTLGLGSSTSTMLDIGCGDGLLLYNLRNKFGKICGVEFSQNRAQYAKENLIHTGSHIVCGDFLNIEFDEKFDVVSTTDVIEHIPDIFAFFEKANNIIKQDGYLLINTPNVMYFRYRFKFFFGIFPSTSLADEGMQLRNEEDLYDGGHLHYFTFGVMRKMAKRFGFEVVKEIGIGSKGKIHNIRPTLTSGSCSMALRKIKEY